MPRKMPAVESASDDDEWIFITGGRKRRISKSALMSGIDQRMRNIENGPSNGALGQRLGSLESWRNDKATPIPDVNTSGMSVEVAGVSVATASAINQVAGKLNVVLAALRQREVIDA